MPNATSPDRGIATIKSATSLDSCDDCLECQLMPTDRWRELLANLTLIHRPITTINRSDRGAGLAPRPKDAISNVINGDRATACHAQTLESAVRTDEGPLSEVPRMSPLDISDSGAITEHRC
jgi:hypothetical protein